MGNIYVNIAFEDALSEIVIQRILVHAGEKANRKFVILRRYRGRGFGGLKAKIEKFNAASVITPYVVLTDLDQNKCPVALVKEWLKCDLHANMIFRIAVREVEVWLLADEDKLRAYLSVNKVYRVENPDSIEDPKNFIFQMVRKSKSKVIKDAILPKVMLALTIMVFLENLCWMNGMLRGQPKDPRACGAW